MVLNFKNSTPGDRAHQYQPWEFGLASMIMTDIESIGLFNVISRERLKDILIQQAMQQTGVVDPQDAVRIGKIVAAKYILSGEFVEMGGTMRIDARVFSVEKGYQLGASSVTGQTESFFQLEKKLVVLVSKYLNAMLTKDEIKRMSENIETRSMQASLHNYAGEMALAKAQELKQKGRNKDANLATQTAKRNFKEALHYDPEYRRAKHNLSKLVLGMPMTL
jgi:TolB-like protein